MAESNSKSACKYGENCYQRNEAHLNRFSHPPKIIASTESVSKKSHGSPISDQNEKETSKRTTIRSSGDETTVTKKIKALNPLKEDRHASKSPSPLPSESNDSETSKSNLLIVNYDDNSAASMRTNNGPDQKHDIDFINNTFDKDSQFSQRTEYKNLLINPELFIKDKFLVEMPSDFYQFWDYCLLQKKDGQNAECIFDQFGLNLVGPFDVLAGKFDKADLYEPGDYLRHWRYYYDPPEFQTFLRKDKTGIHYGYWRDDPDNNCLIARNDSTKNCEFNFIADNLFTAVIYFLDKEIQLTPFNRPAAIAAKKSLEDFALKNKISLTSFSPKLKARNVLTVCKTFHKAGLVVPYDRKTDVGYRQLIESDANLKKILNKFSEAKGDQERIDAAMEELQPLIRAANIAVDECDFGNSIELGIDLFCFGAPELHNVLLQLLVNGYTMVNKPQFIAIFKAHLERRTKGITPSILNS